MNGWWKFHRRMFDSKVWTLPPLQRLVWISILNLANHKDGTWWNGTEFVTIQAGSFVTSQTHLAEQSGTSRQIVRDCLIGLERGGSISTKIRTKSYTQIIVTNWPLYQGTDTDENQEENQVRTKSEPSENQVRTITEEGKKERRKEKDKDSCAVPSNGDGPAPAALPDWLIEILKASPTFSALLAPKYTRFWSSMSATFDPYEWLAWDEELHKADTWIATHQHRKPRCPDRFLLNWFQRAVDIGRIQRAKEEGARRSAESR